MWRARSILVLTCFLDILILSAAGALFPDALFPYAQFAVYASSVVAIEAMLRLLRHSIARGCRVNHHAITLRTARVAMILLALGIYAVSQGAYYYAPAMADPWVHLAISLMTPVFVEAGVRVGREVLTLSAISVVVGTSALAYQRRPAPRTDRLT